MPARWLRSALAVFIGATTLQAQAWALDLGFAKEDGGRPGAFLNFAASARSMALGGAYTGVANDASATYWNPSGLAQLQQKDLVANYSSLYEQSSLSAVNYAQPTVDYGTFGLGVVSLNTRGVPRRDSLGKSDGSYSASQLALLLGHGVSVGPRWSLGSSLKVVRQEVDTFAATGYGLDASAMYNASPSMQAGITVQNILAPRLKLREEADRYPLVVRLGGRWHVSHKWMISADLDQSAGRSLKPLLGAEWAATDMFALRGGINEREITTGIGFKLKDWGLDYAFAYQDAAAGIGDLGASHRFGFHMNFGRKVFEQEASLRWQKKGQDVLAQLRVCAADKTACSTEDIQKFDAILKQVIRRQGFARAEDLYAAQGYAAYLNGQYERSVQSLAEALALSPANSDLTEALQKARAEMTEESTRAVIALELKRIKDSYAAGDWKTTVKSCEKVLGFEPGNAEALAYLQDAQNRIREPIEREMKIATMKYERGDYLDTLKTLQRVNELDPNNVEAAALTSQVLAALDKQASSEAVVVNDSAKSAHETEQDKAKGRELYSQGLVLYSQGKLKDAADMWEKAVRVDPNNVLARSAYNRVQIEMSEKP